MNLTRRLLSIFSTLLLFLMPLGAPSAAAVSAQRKGIERYPFYDKTAENICDTPNGATQSTGSAGTGPLYFLGDSIGEGLASAGLASQLQSNGYQPKINADQNRSITGKGKNTNTSGLEAVAIDAGFIKTANVVIIELGTNPENNFAGNLDKLIAQIKALNGSTKIYLVDVAATPSTAQRIGAVATNQAIYQRASSLGTPVISRFKLYYPNGDPQTYTNLGTPALAFDSLGVHSTSAKDYQLLNDVIKSNLTVGAVTGATSQVNPCSCPADGVAPSTATANITGSDNIEKAFNYFIGKGLSPAQSAGIVGNLIAESGVNPKRVQSTPTPGGDRDTITVDNRTGYGIAQWTSSGRQQGLVDLSRQRGLSIQGDLPLQLDYLLQELTTGYKDVYNSIKLAPDVTVASSIFMTKFERPKDQSPGAQAKRAANGQKVLDLYGDGSSTDSALQAGTANCNTTSSGVVSGFVGFPLQTTKARMTQLNSVQFVNGTMTRGGHPYAAYDIMADPGTPVLAILSGKVVQVSTDKCPGRLVAVYNQEVGVTVAYLHMSLSQTIVKVGDTITAGQNIGFVGPPAAGCGTPHLHIDANTTDRRIACKRESCPTENQKLFEAGDAKIGLGVGLYNAYMKLP